MGTSAVIYKIDKRQRHPTTYKVLLDFTVLHLPTLLQDNPLILIRLSRIGLIRSQN